MDKKWDNKDTYKLLKVMLDRAEDKTLFNYRQLRLYRDVMERVLDELPPSIYPIITCIYNLCGVYIQMDKLDVIYADELFRDETQKKIFNLKTKYECYLVQQLKFQISIIAQKIAENII